MYKRFLVSTKIENDNFEITGDEHIHLSSVLRLKNNDIIIVTCDDEFDYISEIVAIEKKSTKCKVIKKEINKSNPNKKIDCFHALIKNDKMSLVTQKLNELGISNLVLFESTFQTVKASDNKRDKLQKISDQSSKQCKRSMSMNIIDVVSFTNMVKQLSVYDLVVFANETEESLNLCDIVNSIQKAQSIAIIIGSEGGFSQDEILEIKRAGAKSVTLGNRILRAETASISLAAFVGFISKN